MPLEGKRKADYEQETALIRENEKSRKQPAHTSLKLPNGHTRTDTRAASFVGMRNPLAGGVKNRRHITIKLSVNDRQLYLRTWKNMTLNPKSNT